MSLKNKVALVTGGGSGIGRACSIQLARDGASVAVWDLNREHAAQTVRSIQSEGGKAGVYVGDATEPDANSQILASIRAEFGPVLILVNNAGISHFKTFLEITREDLERIYRINVFGPFLLTQATVPDMLTAGWGRIIFISCRRHKQVRPCSRTTPHQRGASSRCRGVSHKLSPIRA